MARGAKSETSPDSSPRPFASAEEFRRWLEANHGSAGELTVLFYKKGSGRGGLTYAEALDAALCFGWIDGVRRGLDPESYTIRFTPRRPNSIWSMVNVRHVERLIREQRMKPSGAAAFAARREHRTGLYSFENKPKALPAAFERQFRQSSNAWTFFQAQPPGYRRTILWWVLSAKQDATRQRRLKHLIEQSAAGRRLDPASPFDRASRG